MVNIVQATKKLIEELKLEPHPEGGHYREVFRSNNVVNSAMGERRAVTAIYYLLSKGEIGRWHVVPSEEIWNFYSGDPLELFIYDPLTQRLDTIVLTNQAPLNAIGVVPSGCWQAALPLGDYSLVGCVVAPGFEFVDFRLVRDLPGHEPHFSGVLSPLANLL